MHLPCGMHHLHEVSDAQPGLQRIRRGEEFVYLDTGGREVKTASVLRRIRSLVIPPAWREVWICLRADGHIQATGRDARDRKQYRYHPDWVAWREEQKTCRLTELAAALPRIRRRAARELRAPKLTREKVMALMVRLLEITAIRAGHDEYAAQNGSYGLASMKDSHAVTKGGTLEFRFRGKGGKQHAIPVEDPLLRRLVEHCRRLPGRALFQYEDAEGHRHRIRAGDLNAWLKEVSGRNITAKDLRTWTATVHAFSHLKKRLPFRSAAEARRNVKEVIKTVAAHLGNTPAICRKSYIHAAVMEAYCDGRMGCIQALRRSGLNTAEAAVFALLTAPAAKEKPLREQLKLSLRQRKAAAA